MAEAASLVASILGISSFAIRLTKNLYEFGSAVSSARSQIDRIARNISNYALVLDLLAERLADDAPVHSEKALKLVHDLRDQSNELLYDINDLLPRPRSGRRRVSLTNRLVWDLKKSKVDLLVGELEYLKTSRAQSIYSCRCSTRGRDQSLPRSRNKRISNGRIDAAKVRQRVVRAETALYEQFIACEQLPILEIEAESDSWIANGPADQSSRSPSPTFTQEQGSILANFEADGRQIHGSHQSSAIRVQEQYLFG